jgi:hypothetical protein
LDTAALAIVTSTTVTSCHLSKSAASVSDSYLSKGQELREFRAVNAEVERLREILGEWINENTHRANDTAISIATLETAFDRYIELLGESDAFDLIESAFRQRAEIFRRSLQ